MKPSTFLYGLAGGVVGFLTAGPLVLHEGWARMAQYRQEHPASDWALFFASMLLFPVLMILGVLGSPAVSLYTGYRTGSENSFDSILETFIKPYRTPPGTDKFVSNVSMGMLMGYSTVISLTAFTILNAFTGNMFGFLGASGALLYSTFHIPHASFTACLIATTVLSYFSALIGGAIAAVGTICTEAYREEHLPPPTAPLPVDEPPYVELQERPRFPSQYRPPIDQTQSKLSIFLWGKRPEAAVMDPLLNSYMSSEDDETEEVLEFRGVGVGNVSTL